MSERSVIHVALWFDRKDKMIRIAGAYRTERAADKRVAELDCGAVQSLKLGKPIRFTHEKKQESGHAD